MSPLHRISMILALGVGTGLLSTSAHAIDSSKVSQIRSMVAQDDIRGLMSFIEQNPDVLDSSPLGQSLSEFAVAPPDPVERFLGVGVPTNLSDMAARSATDSSLY